MSDGGCPVSVLPWRPTLKYGLNSGLNFMKKIVKKVDRRVCQTVLSDNESVRFVRIERHIPSV